MSGCSAEGARNEQGHLARLDVRRWIHRWPRRFHGLAFDGAAPSSLAEEIIRTTGAILAGRRWYDIAREKYDGVVGIYGGGWTGPVFVLTHRSGVNPTEPRVTFVSGSVGEGVATARAAAGEKNVVILGANAAQQCLSAGLVDELTIHLVPVLLGDGIRLYGAPGVARIKLTKTELEETGQQTAIRFSVRTDRSSVVKP